MKKIFAMCLVVILASGIACDNNSQPNDPLTTFKAHKAEQGESWAQFKHDVSFNVWVFPEGSPRPQEHRSPQAVRVFWDGNVSAEEFSLIDGGLTEMLAACRRDTTNWQPGNIWTKFEYFQKPSDFKVLFVPSNYTLQEGEAKGCAGMITGAQGSITAAGTVGGIIGINNKPGSKGGIYIMIPKQTPAQFARTECKQLMKNAVKHEAEHVWFTNNPSLFYAFANDGLNGNHPYCRGNEPL